MLQQREYANKGMKPLKITSTVSYIQAKAVYLPNYDQELLLLTHIILRFRVILGNRTEIQPQHTVKLTQIMYFLDQSNILKCKRVRS